MVGVIKFWEPCTKSRLLTTAEVIQFWEPCTSIRLLTTAELIQFWEPCSDIHLPWMMEVINNFGNPYLTVIYHGRGQKIFVNSVLPFIHHQILGTLF